MRAADVDTVAVLVARLREEESFGTFETREVDQMIMRWIENRAGYSPAALGTFVQRVLQARNEYLAGLPVATRR